MRVTDIKWTNKKGQDRIGYYMDEFLGINLMGIPEYLKKSWDVVGVISGHGKVRIGKTLKKGSKVLMADGTWKFVEDIKIGDEVISPQKDGVITYEKVTEVHNRYEEDCYDIIEESTKKVLYSCAGNHDIPIFKNNIKKRKYEFKILEAKELAMFSTKAKNQFYCMSSPCLEYKGNIEPKINPYCLGVWLGDGHFNKDLGITSNDFRIVEEISRIYPIMNILKKKDTTAKTYRFSINGEFSKQLISLGLRGKNSGTKFIPNECLIASKEFRLNLLAGLIDTDGYITKGNSIALTTKSKLLADSVKELVFSLGGSSSIRGIRKKCQTGYIGDYFNVKISFTDNTSIPLKVKYKKDRTRNSSFNRNHVYIKCVKSTPSEVYGFSITGKSKWHITDNWMITHNSTLAQQIGYFLAWLLAGGRMEWRIDPDGVKRWYVARLPTKPVRFNLEDNIVFSPEDLMKAATNLREKYGRNQVIIYDEGRAGLDSARAMQAINKAMQDFFQECGQHGHIILIVLPDFFKLHEDYATVRSLFLVDVFADRQLRRGWFNFYNEAQKEKLYVYGKKVLGLYNRYSQASPSFYGRFTGFLPTDEKAYDTAKQKALRKKQFLRNERKFKTQRDAAIYILKRETDMSCEEIATEMTAAVGQEVSEEHVKNAIKAITHEKDDEEIL